MPQTKHEIQAILESQSFRPRRQFGQNFMIDANLVRCVADAGGVSPGDLVVEIGPGTGTLTEELLNRGADLLAVEIDRGLAGLLRNRFADQKRFRLIESDALSGKHMLNESWFSHVREAKSAGRIVRLIANLPYNIASPLVIESLIAGVDVLAFTVQKEVADRFVAPVSGEDYGPLSVMAQLLSRVEILRKLPPQAFWPMPTVESALVRMERADQLGGRASLFSAFVHRLFSSRRKTLRRALEQAGADADAVLATTGISPQLRPENLTPAQFLQLANEKGSAAWTEPSRK